MKGSAVLFALIPVRAGADELRHDAGRTRHRGAGAATDNVSCGPVQDCCRPASTLCPGEVMGWSPNGWGCASTHCIRPKPHTAGTQPTGRRPTDTQPTGKQPTGKRGRRQAGCRRAGRRQAGHSNRRPVDGRCAPGFCLLPRRSHGLLPEWVGLRVGAAAAAGYCNGGVGGRRASETIPVPIPFPRCQTRRVSDTAQACATAADHGEAASLMPTRMPLCCSIRLGQAKLTGSTPCSTTSVAPSACRARRTPEPADNRRSPSGGGDVDARVMRRRLRRHAKSATKAALQHRCHDAPSARCARRHPGRSPSRRMTGNMLVSGRARGSSSAGPGADRTTSRRCSSGCRCPAARRGCPWRRAASSSWRPCSLPRRRPRGGWCRFPPPAVRHRRAGGALA